MVLAMMIHGVLATGSTMSDGVFVGCHRVLLQGRTEKKKTKNKHPIICFREHHFSPIHKRSLPEKKLD